MLNNLVYFTSIIFIISNLYYLFNYKRLDVPFNLREKNTKLDYLYYITEALFYIWLLLGTFSQISHICVFLILLMLIRQPIVFISRKLSVILWKLNPIIIIIVMFYVLFRH
jgi:hypothetical protein